MAEACSGVKFFFATTAFGVLYANLFFQSTRRRLVFVACAVVVPVIANGLRVVFTILIGERFGMAYATGTDHMVFGWQFFGLVLLLLFLAGWPWHESESPVVKSSRQPDSAMPSRPATALLAGVCVSLVFFGATAWRAHAAGLTPADADTVAAIRLPAELGGLSGAGAAAGLPDIGTRYDNAMSKDRAYYRDDKTVVRVAYARYPNQSGDGAEVLTYGNRVFDTAAWRVVDRQPAAAGFERIELVQRQGELRSTVWFVYIIGERLTASGVHFKFWQAWYGLRGIAVMPVVVVMSAPGAPVDIALPVDGMLAALAAAGQGNAP